MTLRAVRACGALLLLVVAASAFAQGNGGYASRGEVKAFVDEMVARHGFARDELDRLFTRMRHQPAIVRAMTPQVKGARSWQQYRARFVTRERIDGGVAFWTRHAAALQRAEGRYGVPAEIIVAIIGVETEYGRIMGDFRVAEALATLAFDYPRRADYFRSELEEFLLLAREMNGDALAFRGSYAGAVGLPQFMPGSYRRYAVDFDGDGRRDLRGSAADAIGSVAHFLVRHGWQPGEAVAVPAQAPGDTGRALADGGVETTLTAAALRIAAIDFDPAIADEMPSVLVELDSTDAEPVYWVGFPNFYVITRYNRSSFYAISVLELAQAIQAARGASDASVTALLDIRPATPDDVPQLLALVRALAEYERLTHLFVADEAALHAELFGPRPVIEALLGWSGDAAAAFAIYFHNYSTFLGRRGLYLEDLFVLPEHRGKGFGKAMLRAVARIAHARGAGRFEWMALDWNTPAIDFYKGLGAAEMAEWRLFRATGAALERLATED